RPRCIWRFALGIANDPLFGDLAPAAYGAAEMCRSRARTRHFSISAFIFLARRSAEPPPGSKPSLAKASFTSGMTSAELVALLIASTIVWSVPAGANRPNHTGTSKPGRPDSAIVGASGMTGVRDRLAMPSRRIVPDFTWPDDVETPSNM